MQNVILGMGSILEESKIVNAVIGSRTLIGRNCDISDSIIMGADCEWLTHIIKARP
jgi:ADP-glucose pyrophosphorylase